MAKKSSKKQSVASRIADEERVPIAEAKAKLSRKAKKEVATTTPVVGITQGKTMPVGKLGWADENLITPIVLLDKKTRAELGLEVGNLVAVSKDSKKAVAIVQIQFWELVGTGKCTLNKKLGKLVAVSVSDNVVISKDVTESEVASFRQALARERGRTLAQMFGRAMRDGQGDENPEEE